MAGHRLRRRPHLGRHLTAHGPLAGGTLYAFATGTAQALAVIHEAGVVHRDVKPQNVVLTPAGPRVLDFESPAPPTAPV
ncbi:hypothetical protein GCM10010358_13100 [Streptomyces minutiscleroticus]|uniref:Protein kinase domain-containing protein n=1 Tax=Streptomyces minutiscleroticus TaxID=68238 RepID=A0A918KF70_9ACTN|nr:hypothetical protein GCM10010358_13100 [Streptomyces minutiscleroticus]